MFSDKVFDFTVVFQPASEGGYTVFVPALPGCVTEGDTLEEARRMAEDAIKAYVESLVKDGEPVPEEQGELIGHVRIKTQPA